MGPSERAPRIGNALVASGGLQQQLDDSHALLSGDLDLLQHARRAVSLAAEQHDDKVAAADFAAGLPVVFRRRLL